MTKNAFFKIDTKLAELLGETYRSAEYAIKELIDNAYDADSEKIIITFPEPLIPNPKIIIEDNGSGMKENEVRTEYLNVANSRIVRKGALSISKKRKVKGRKGIGKFAGLMVATKMQLETYANGVKTTLLIDKEELAKGNYDLEKVPLPISTESCEKSKNGTTITLSNLNQNLEFPNPEKMKQILVWEYGRDTDFEIIINGGKIDVLDLQGKSFTEEIEFEGKKAILKYTITPKPIKNCGIVTKIGDKVIGRPQNLLANEEIIPKKLQNRIYGEIICDDLEADVTADWGAIIENSKLYTSIKETTKKHLKNSVEDVFATDMKMAKARFQRTINKELEKLPEFKQPFAKKALYKTLEKFYGESEERISTVISVMISAMEKDHYWGIINNIEDCRESDVEKFANALSEFGMLEMSIITSQTINRLRFLDELSILIANPKALEKDIHQALEKNTWVLGDDYSVLFSDVNLKRAIKEMLDKDYTGENVLNRPDLFLSKSKSRNLVLIEFKRPFFTLSRDTENQAVKYRDELSSYFGNQPIEIILLGGKIKQNIMDVPRGIKYLTYLDIISTAKNNLEWMIDELKIEK
ncbi:Shedu anti-phage system protein SduA domain-containing protein [Formosa undariae]|uniref:Shedu anti-phage system protein SduA domain-containing protein n=1 Tax=Formosa undariae TaxID=1325436 RepID=A0ABV5F3F2_9FLAO